MELTFSQRWRENQLPARDFMVLAIPQSTLMVNGCRLPSIYNASQQSGLPEMTYLHLPAANKDWLPFFSSPEVADHVYGVLAHKLGDDDEGCGTFGFWFSPLFNSIRVVSDLAPALVGRFTPSDGPLFVQTLTDLDQTVRQFESAIKKLDVRCFRSAPAIRESLKDFDFNGGWKKQGESPSSTEPAYHMAKNYYEKIYGYRLSEVPKCYLQEPIVYGSAR